MFVTVCTHDIQDLRKKLKLAYDKINVTAFEENIELSNENYTIFVDQHEDNIVADIFVEKKTDE